MKSDFGEVPSVSSSYSRVKPGDDDYSPRRHEDREEGEPHSPPLRVLRAFVVVSLFFTDDGLQRNVSVLLRRANLALAEQLK